jgi:hypothetical protein
MQESFVAQFGRLQDWEQHMILSTLQRLVAMMDAEQIAAAPILTAEPLDPPPDSQTGLRGGFETCI